MNSILNAFFPPKCVFCGRLLGINSQIDICVDCWNSIDFVQFARTTRGLRPRYFDEAFCVCKYKGILKQGIKKFKFHNKPHCYRAFAEMLFDRIKKSEIYYEIDCILSVPMHKKKEKMRGYNQSKLIAKHISRLMNTPIYEGLLIKIKNTPDQHMLNKRCRERNVIDSFAIVAPELIYGKTILLIDDVLTTGFTLNECSKLLKIAGAKEVFVGVVAS